MNLHMIRAVRLVNAQQKGLPAVDFIAALDDIDVSEAFQELLRRRGGGARNAMSGIADALSTADAVNYLTAGHAFSPYIAASSAAMSTIAASSAAMSTIAASSKAMSTIAASSTAMSAALSSSTALTAIFSVPAAKAAIMSSTALAIASIPKMISATAPYGIASSSSVYSGYPAYNAFDKSAGTFWAGGAGLATNQWIQYSFAGDVFISTVAAQPYGAGYNPVNCRIECSNDNLAFDVVKSFVMNPAGVNTLDVTKAGFYKHWRLFIETIDGSSHPGVKELNFTGFVKP